MRVMGKWSTGKKAAVIAIVVVLVAAVAGVAWCMVDQHNKQVWEQEHKTYPVNLTVLAQGYDPQSSTPIPVVISGNDFEGNAVSVEALAGTATCSEIDLMRGTYLLSVSASPFAADGSMFDVSGTTSEFDVTGDGQTGQGNVSVSMVKLDDSQITEDTINASKDKLTSLGYDEGTLAPFVDAAEDKAQQTQVSAQLADAKAKFSAELEQLNSDFKNDPRLNGPMVDMNASAAEYRQKYDDLVDEIYSYLTSVLTGDDLANLKSSQSAWESEKETGSQQAASGSVGGTMHPLDVNSAAMDYDKERINELLALMG